jgi:hypothetical protein
VHATGWDDLLGLPDAINKALGLDVWCDGVKEGGDLMHLLATMLGDDTHKPTSEGDGLSALRGGG